MWHLITPQSILFPGDAAALSWACVAVPQLLTCTNDWGKHDDFPLALDVFLSHLPHSEALCWSPGRLTCLFPAPRELQRTQQRQLQQPLPSGPHS